MTGIVGNGDYKRWQQSSVLAFASCAATCELQTERYSVPAQSYYQALISAFLNRRFDPSAMLQSEMSQLSQLDLFG